MILGGGTAYRTWLEDEHDFELMYLRGYTGIRHSGRAHVFETRFKLDYLERGHDPFSIAYGATPIYIYGVSDRLQSVTRGVVEYRDFDAADDLDATYLEFAQGGVVGNINDGWSVSLTLAGFYNDARAGEFDYAGGRVTTLASYVLPWQVTLQAAAGFRYSEYRRREVLATKTREDGEWNAGLSLSRPLSPRTNVSLGYRHTTNRSTFDLYDYRRNVVNLSLDYTY